MASNPSFAVPADLPARQIEFKTFLGPFFRIFSFGDPVRISAAVHAP
jgi:hypothetical protein